jgi:hypothetical protein
VSGSDRTVLNAGVGQRRPGPPCDGATTSPPGRPGVDGQGELGRIRARASNRHEASGNAVVAFGDLTARRMIGAGNLARFVADMRRRRRGPTSACKARGRGWGSVRADRWLGAGKTRSTAAGKPGGQHFPPGNGRAAAAKLGTAAAPPNPNVAAVNPAVSACGATVSPEPVSPAPASDRGNRPRRRRERTAAARAA